MDQTNQRPHLFGLLAGLFLATGIAFASIVFARTWTHLRESQVIDVTGSARKDIRSDLVVWTGRVTTEDSTLLGAYAKLKADLMQVDEFLKSKGFASYTLAPVQVHPVTARSKEIESDDVVTRRLGYQLSQLIEVRSVDVIALPRLSSDCATLIEHGVAFTTEGIQFIYTKAGQTKVEMMALATQDARNRAEQIAASGSRQVRELRSAKMGVVQINPIYSSGTSWEGNNDTTSLEKTITVTVTAQFSLK